MCFICLENDSTEEELRCGHSFHKDCLKNIIYPVCPLCRSDITYFIQNFKTKKQIKNDIEIEKYRVMITSIHNYYNELGTAQLFNVITRIKKLNKIKAYENYFKIIKSIIECNGKDFQNLFNKNNETDFNEGIFLYFCDTNTFINNLLNGYKHTTIKWLKRSDFEIFKPITSNAIGLFKKTQYNKKSFPVLIVLQDNTKYYIEPLIIKDVNLFSIPTLTSSIKLLCEEQPLENFHQFSTPDSEYIMYLFKDEEIPYIYYNTVYEFFEKYMCDILKNTDGQSGMIEVIFQNKNPDKKIFEYNYTFKKKNDNTIKYYYNKKKISVKKMGYYIQNTMGDENDLLIRIFSNDEILSKSTLTSILCNCVINLLYRFSHFSKHKQYELYDISQTNFKTNINLTYEYA